MSVFDELGLPDPSLPSGAPASVFASLGLPDPVAKPSGIVRRALGDTGVSLAKGIIGVPEAAVGLANLPTGGMAGKAAQAIGFAPKEWKESLDEYYSPEQKAANAAVPGRRLPENCLELTNKCGRNRPRQPLRRRMKRIRLMRERKAHPWRRILVREKRQYRRLPLRLLPVSLGTPIQPK